MLMAIRRKTKIIQGRRSDRLLDDKRKTPCCLMAAWGFALGRSPVGAGDDFKGAVVEEDEFYGLFEDF